MFNSPATTAHSGTTVLQSDTFAHYVAAFNQNDKELYTQYIPNTDSWDWMRQNIPLFECPDKDTEEIYYFRWWTFRKHIKHTPDGFIITEFLPSVTWAGKANSISCAAAHHFREGRWISDPRYLDDYAHFWFRKGGSPRSYSFWAADSLEAYGEVTGDERLTRELLPDLIQNYNAWESDHRDPNGLYWQKDDRDGMEKSISGTLDPQHLGYRATINSYQFGDALAIARMAERFGEKEVADQYRAKAAEIQQLVQERLWNPKAQFFEVIPHSGSGDFSDVRELHGYTPWYFDMPDSVKSVAWEQLMDPKGFYAPFGPTTAEQRHPKFAVAYQGHECLWDGPSWPFATSVTLTAMANLLDHYSQDVVSAEDYFDLLKIYTKSHRLTHDDGRALPWIDENLNPYNGDWISRTRLKTWKNGTWDPTKGGEERGKDYNHSTYCDLIISGLVGLRPRADSMVEIKPLIPKDWDYFCLDNLRYHGCSLTIFWDRTGKHYGKGQGLRVLANGNEMVVSHTLSDMTGHLPSR